MIEYTEGVCEDGAAILADGVPITISEVLERLNKGEAFKAINPSLMRNGLDLEDRLASQERALGVAVSALMEASAALNTIRVLSRDEELAEYIEGRATRAREALEGLEVKTIDQLREEVTNFDFMAGLPPEVREKVDK